MIFDYQDYAIYKIMPFSTYHGNVAVLIAFRSKMVKRESNGIETFTCHDNFGWLFVTS